MTANSLANLQPHAPTADPFADTWYCYLHDPAFGFVKVAFLTYLNDQTAGGPQHGYVHVATAPVDGEPREHDHWFPAVVSEAVTGRGPGAFRFEVPGVVIDESRLSVDLPEVGVEIELDGPYVPYFPAPDPAASPFMGPMEDLPSAQSHWFVVTLGTPATYRYRDDRGTTEGRGLLYGERGWSTRQAHGFCYLVAVGEEAKLVLTCGMPDGASEVWAGRLSTPRHDLTVLPFAGDTSVTSRIDPASGRAQVTMTQGEVELRVESEAPLAAFYDQVTPSLTVFHADHPVAKTMSAHMRVQVARNGEVVEEVRLAQSILEFGGVLYPPGLAALTRADRPAYRYEGQSTG